MKTINIDKIETIRTLSVDMLDDVDAQESDQLISPFEGRFYIKFADNQYKPFDQVVDQENEATKQAKKETNVATKNEVVMVDYAGQQATDDLKVGGKRLEGVIADLFNDMTDLNHDQLELDEITENDLYGDDC